MTKKRDVVDARADKKGKITHVKIEGNEKFTPLEQAMNMAERGELGNAHRVKPSNGGDYLRTNPDSMKKNNLDDMAGDN